MLAELLIQSQQWKQQNIEWNLFKVNNDAKTTSWANFTHSSGVSTVNFEQVNADWDSALYRSDVLICFWEINLTWWSVAAFRAWLWKMFRVNIERKNDTSLK